MSPAPFARIRPAQHDGVRRPYQPLLALYALGRWARDERDPIRFVEAEEPLRALMAEFGPRVERNQAELPFWALQSGGDWEVTPADLPARLGGSGPSALQLRESDARGEFSAALRGALLADPELVGTAARRLFRDHFPPTLHEDILGAVGLELDVVVAPRDAAFRTAVLVAYGSACAVCRAGVRLVHTPVGVEAAHIRWHSCGGPDEVPNGLCLCALHHKLFDRGAFALTTELRVEVSDEVNGENAAEVLHRHHDRPVAVHAPPIVESQFNG